MKSVLRRAVGSLLLFLAGAAAAQGIGPAKPQFFAQPPAVSRAANAPGIESQATPVRFNAAEMGSRKYLEEVQLDLPNGISHAAVVDLVQDHGSGIVSWVGRLKHSGNHRVIVTTGPAGSYGVIDTPEGSFRILPGDGHDWLVDMTAEKRHLRAVSLEEDVRLSPAVTEKAVQQYESEPYVALPGVNSLPMTKAAPTSGYVVDIMFVVTNGLATKLGANLVTRLQFLVARANASYADSDVAIRLRMVHHVIVNYSDATTNGVALAEISPLCTGSGSCDAAFNAGVFGSIEALRNTYGADVVALMRDGSATGGGGIAWLGQRNAGSTTITNPSYMYSVTTGCVSTCESVFIHEVGHNMGLQHDRATDAWQAGGRAYPPSGQYNYGYYYCASGALTCNPEVAGSCTSQPECAVTNPSNFSDLMAYFHASTEGNYKFSNPNGTCRGEPGQTPQPCGIAQMADGTRWLNEVRAAVSAIKPTQGTYTDGPVSTDSWPPGNVLPAGFSSTGNAWTVATDRVYEGTHSLRSAQVYGTYSFPPTTFTNSDLTYSGAFTAGNIGFMYQVSGWAPNGVGYGILEFAIDDVVVLADTGETGWKYFAYPVTAGSHTLRWRFKNAIPSACSGQALATANCADRAWIDAVSLPVTATTLYGLTVQKSGAGSGTVTSSPAGIICGATCTFSYASGTMVTLTAAASGGSMFLGWSGGGCTGTGACQVTLSSATTVTADFAVQAGTPTGAALPTTLDFGGQSMQTTSAPMNITLTNVGTGTLTISGVTASTGYAQTNNCTSLAAAASCTATVRFTPATQGAVAGTLTFQTSSGNVSVALAGTGERSLVTHYYRAILNRAPDTAGKSYWEGEATRLTALGVDINETWYVMAGYFFNSAEYISYNKTSTQFVTDLYNTFFNRAPDSGGLNYWVGEIAAGLPREVVLFSFMFSPEFRTFTQGIFGNTAARPEVNMVVDFFRGLLNRVPDTPSFNYWLGRLRTAQCAGAGPVYTEVGNISQAFMYSPEYGNRGRNNTQFVTDMYYSFLRRGGDRGGVDYWIQELVSGRRAANTVRNDFLNSPEFGVRVQAVIAAGCAQ